LELNQCSFKPTINRKVPSKEEVEVKGMQTFLEHVNRIKLKEEEKENRRKEVFGIAEGGHLKT